MERASRSERVGGTKKGIWFRPMGANTQLMATKCNSNCITRTSDHPHFIYSQDVLHCGYCQVPITNPVQHQGENCQAARHHTIMTDRFRDAHLYLKQRHYEHPAYYEDPGHFVMYHPRLTKEMMNKIPLEVLEAQGTDWNVLMPIQTTLNLKKAAKKKYVADHMNALLEEYGQLKDKSGWMCSTDSDMASEDEEEVEEHPENTVEQSEKTKGDSMHVCTEWELGHDSTKNTCYWDMYQQDEMEEGRATIVKNWGGKALYCLPAQTTAEKKNPSRQQVMDQPQRKRVKRDDPDVSTKKNRKGFPYVIKPRSIQG